MIGQPVAEFVTLEAFIAQWLPRMLNAPVTRVSVQIGQDVPGFERLPLVVRDDWRTIPKELRSPARMLVRFGYVNLTP